MTPTFFAALVLLAGLFGAPSAALGWTLVWSVFGAGAAVILTSLGGNPISPALASLPFLVWHALKAPAAPTPPGPGPGSGRLGPGFWLALCIGWAVLGALFVPRLLADDVAVFVTQRATTSRAGVLLLPLQPVSGNFTQTIYALGSLAVFLCAGRLAAHPGGLSRLRGAMAALAAVIVASAVLNIGETYLGLPSLLALVRNGGYAVMVGGDVGGLQRMTGTFPEASAFVSFTLPVFAFCFALWLQGERARWPAWAAAALAVAILLATSTTGYVAMAAYLGGVALMQLRRVLSAESQRLWRLAVMLLFLALIGIVVLLLVHPGAAAKFSRFYDVVLGHKLASSSGEERMRWNLQGLANLVDSFGLGVGLGSARASSFAVVLLSNLGLLGALLYALFVATVFRAPWLGPAEEGEGGDRRIRSAFRHAFAAALCAAVVSGTVFERGPAFYIYAAAASVLGLAARAAPATRTRLRASHRPMAAAMGPR